MTIEDLVKSAEILPKTTNTSCDEYEANYEKLVDKVNKKMVSRDDIVELVGKANIEMMKNNHSNHARFIISILHTPNARQLVETVVWVFRAYRSRGFHPNYWCAQLNVWLDVMKETFNDITYKEIYPLYNWLIINIPSFTDLSEEAADESSSLVPKPEH